MTKSELLALKYHKLAPEEQDIVLVLAVVYSPIGVMKFKELLTSLKHINRKSIKLLDSKLLKDKLDKAGLIELSRDGWRSPKALRDELMKVVVKDRPDVLAEIKRYFNNYNDFIGSHLQLTYFIRKLRLAVYDDDIESYTECFNDILNTYPERIVEVIDVIVFDFFDEAWFFDRLLPFRLFILNYYLTEQRFNLNNMADKENFGSMTHIITYHSKSTPFISLIEK